MARLTMLGRIALVMALGLMAACTSMYQNHGYIPPEQDLAQIVVGQTTREDVVTLVGRPGTAGLLEGADWYYVGSRWRYYGVTEPKEIERQVVAIRFTPEGVVRNVERFGMERGRVVALSQRITTANIEGLSMIRQLLSGLGRLNPGQMLGGSSGGGNPGQL
ncbi:outer membrane protein assembly factor BamE [Paracoccus sp. p4-l81]|uniref:outer membrane protein assembly factor BamE n=1 Tax=unclassified Paracoccus (in: a-proteobacteria) TaxID=2688777 RepID=UPI0035BB057F